MQVLAVPGAGPGQARPCRGGRHQAAANASKHKAMSYGRMGQAEAELAAEVEGWLAPAEAADAAEDAALGADRRGDEMPDWMRDKQRAWSGSGRPRRSWRPRRGPRRRPSRTQARKADGSPRGRRGRKPKHPPGDAEAKAQRNFTDPESRIMKGRDGFVQAYNAQAAVDATAQVIVAHRLTNNAADHDALAPLLDAVTANTDATPEQGGSGIGYHYSFRLEIQQSVGGIGVRVVLRSLDRQRPAAARPQGHDLPRLRCTRCVAGSPLG